MTAGKRRSNWRAHVEALVASGGWPRAFEESFHTLVYNEAFGAQQKRHSKCLTRTVATANGADPHNGVPDEAEFTDATEEREERLHCCLMTHGFEKGIELLVIFGSGVWHLHSDAYHRRG